MEINIKLYESGSDSESLVLTELKNIFFTKIGGTKKNHGPNSAAPPVYTNNLSTETEDMLN
jgi:hypothetical protein